MKFFTSIFIIFAASSLEAQNFNWAKQFGGTNSNYGNKVVVDVAGNVYSSGYFNGTVDFDPGPGVYNLSQPSGAGAYISKLDANGNFVWAKQFTSFNIVSYSIALDATGNVYTTGFFQQIADFDPGPGVYNLTTSGTGANVFISKLDNNGNFVWAKQFGGIGNIYLGSYGITVDAAGNVYTTGHFNGISDFDPGPIVYNLTPIAFTDIFVSKLDNNGDFVWARQFGGTSFEEGQSIKVDASSNVYTTGYFQGTVDFDPGVGTYNLSAGGVGFFISKLDGAGNFIFARAVTGASQGKGENICLDAGNNVFIAGHFRGAADFDPGAGTNNLTANDIDAFLLKLDASGNFSWVSQFGGSGQDRAHEVMVDALGSILLTGDFSIVVDFDPGPGVSNLTSVGGFDIFLLKLDNAGNLVWVDQIGGVGDDISYSIKVDGAGNVYSTGLFNNTADFDPGVPVYNLTSLGGDNGYVLKLSSCTYPTITSLSPTSGPVGATVTINGSNFDPVPSNNIVYFGATKANIIAANTSSLTVTVPFGATYQFVTETNSCNLTASSANPFNVTFPCGGDITNTSFAPRVDLGVWVNPADAEIGDFDGDGKSDIVASCYGSSFISIFRNTSAIGNIVFGPRQDFPSNISCIGLAIGDLDGDGKLDIAEASGSVGSVSLFRNISSVGNISFAPLVDLSASSMTRLVSIADFDGDGKPDIVATNEGANTISVFKNNSSPGSFSFSPKTDYVIGPDHTWGVCTGDIDGDGKPDIAVTNYTNSFVSVLRNTSTLGSISFAPKIDFAPGTNPTGISIGDLDGDGKADLAVANQTSNNISVFRNTSTLGSISFAPKADFNTASSPTAISITDLNGDGKPDLSAASLSAAIISLLKNTSTTGNISFASYVDLPTGGGGPLSVALGDFDGDTKPDCLVTNWTSYNKLSVFRNITGGMAVPSVVISTPSTTICAGTSITFTASPTNGGTNPSYQWRINGINVGANSPTYSNSSLVNGDVVTVIMTSNATCASPTTVTSNSITVSVLPLIIPSVSITATATTICAGTSVTFTVTPTNGGPAPAYQWQVNGVNVGTNSATYTTTTLINGDVVRAIMTSNAACASPITATSNAITMTVNATIAPSVGIAPSSTTICAGTSVTFTAMPTNGGSTPAYQWQVNGVNVGTNSAIYSTNTLANGDVVRVIMTSNLTCALPATATSNSITMAVNPSLIPGVSITASSTTICVGASVSFTATPANGGATPVYQWKVNGANVGINSSSYTTTSLANGDVVTVMMTSNATCASPATVTSGAISMSVSSPVTPSVSIAIPITTICAGTSVTFTATSANGGGAPFYQWQVNGGNVGTNSPTFSSNALINGDVVRVIMTSNLACATSGPVTSNSISMTIINVVVAPSISIASLPNLICYHAQVTFTASQVNGGGSPSYQWMLNGANTGTNSPTYITNSLSNGDIVRCQLTSSAQCPIPKTVVSNDIVVSIDPNLCPQSFYMPTAFTPNNDGKNDMLRPIVFGNIMQYKLMIFGRWGEKVFETDDIRKGWDGKIIGHELNSDVFVWYCTFQFQGKSIESRKGTVTLIH